MKAYDKNDENKVRNLFGKVRRIYMVGIGGTGMSGIAEILLGLGFSVSGSDLKDSPVTTRLRRLGAGFVKGHDSDAVLDSDVVIVSTAIPKDNPEVMKAEKAGITVIPRAEMLGELMRLKKGIAVAGAHGKTTVTSIIGHILSYAGLDPTIIVGGRLQSTGSGGKLGYGDWLVAEACESDGTFLKLTPEISVITSIDREHLDFYADLDEIKDAFRQFASMIPFYGLLVLCLDDPNIQSLIPSIKRRYRTYGTGSGADLTALNIKSGRDSVSFDLRFRGEFLGRAVSPLPGMHNVRNVLAAVLVSMELEIPIEKILEGIAGFSGVGRRFEFVGSAGGVRIFDDYGHHPTEIKAVLEAAASRVDGDERIIAIVQPHRYSRVEALMEEFSTCFYGCDLLFVTDIYPAGEKPRTGITGEIFAEEVRTHGHRGVTYVDDIEKLPSRVAGVLRKGDLVITLGAGDIWKVGRRLLETIGKSKV